MLLYLPIQVNHPYSFNGGLSYLAHCSNADIFPEIFKLLNILLTLPVETATVERSFSRLKLVKMRLCSRISDSNLAKLMRIAIEAPDLTAVDFNEIIDVFKEKNHHINL